MAFGVAQPGTSSVVLTLATCERRCVDFRAKIRQRPAMVGWHRFRMLRSDLAEGGLALLYQVGVGLAFLATVRVDGGPRVHPMCLLIVQDRLVAFIVPSPKLDDLRRDRRYALHSFPSPQNEDAFYLVGRAEERGEAELRDAAASLFISERQMTAAPPGFEDHILFEFLIERCLLSRTTGHGDPAPQHSVWKAAD
jgi:hypothetical protein